MKNKISLCMIVKNEESNLRSCLESVQAGVDEIVIVDTGSTDKTIDIAKEYTGKIFHYDWNDDFSSARNHSLKQATGDWILILDADEVLPMETVNQLKTIVETKPNFDAIGLQIINTDGKQVIGHTHNANRLVKNKNGLLFHYRIHEQPFINGNPIDNRYKSELEIFHTGYREEDLVSKNKKERNITILKKELEHKPKDNFIHFNIANEYLSVNKYEKALYHYQIASNNNKFKNLNPVISLRTVICLYQMEKYEEAIKKVNNGIKKYRDYTDLYYYKGIILEKMGFEIEAVQTYEQCIKLGTPRGTYYSTNGVGDKLAYQRLAAIFNKNRNLTEAVKYLSDLLALDKNNKDNIKMLFEILNRHSPDDEVLQLATTTYSKNNSNDLVNLMQIALVVRNKDFFIDIYECLKERMEEEKVSLVEFYYNLYISNFSVAKTILSELNIDKIHINALSILYYTLSKDDTIFNQIEVTNTTKTIAEFLNSNKKPKKNLELDSATYIAIIRELFAEKEYKTVEQLLDLETYFPPKIFKEIAIIFDNAYSDELALQYYSKHLEKENNSPDISLRMSELLFSMGAWDEGIAFAEKTLQTQASNFKPVEIIIETYKKLNKPKIVKEIKKDFKKQFKFSEFLS